MLKKYNEYNRKQYEKHYFEIEKYRVSSAFRFLGYIVGFMMLSVIPVIIYAFCVDHPASYENLNSTKIILILFFAVLCSAFGSIFLYVSYLGAYPDFYKRWIRKKANI